MLGVGVGGGAIKTALGSKAKMLQSQFIRGSAARGQCMAIEWPKRDKDSEQVCLQKTKPQQVSRSEFTAKGVE